MEKEHDEYKYKRRVRVDVSTHAEGIPMSAYVFLAPGQRLLDLMNDLRPFLPLGMEDGGVVIVNKSTIHNIMKADENG